MTSHLCLFDLDQTLVPDRTIERLADAFGVTSEVKAAFAARGTQPAGGIDESTRVARLFQGVDAGRFDAACADLEFRPGAREVVDHLQGLGFRVGVATASYAAAAEAARDALGLDFAIGAFPVVRDGRLTGDLEESPFTGHCGTYICKERILEAERVEGGYVVAVGDGLNDRCMFEAADLAVALAPCPLEVRLAADVVIHDLRALPALVEKHMNRPVVLSRR